MENNKALRLQQYLRDKLADVSLSINSDKPENFIIILDKQYKDALMHGASLFCLQTKEEKSKINHPFESYIGLNGDKALLYFIENKGLENIDVYIKHGK